MPGFLKRIVATALLMAAGCAGLNAQSVTTSTVTQSQPWNFTKQAFDANGAPLTGPSRSVRRSITSSATAPGTTPSGPVTIDDTLSPNLSYVNPSITAPPGWTWTTPPYSVGNQETYSNPGFGPGLSFTVNVPVGGAAAIGHVGWGRHFANSGGKSCLWNSAPPSRRQCKNYVLGIGDVGHMQQWRSVAALHWFGFDYADFATSCTL